MSPLDNSKLVTAPLDPATSDKAWNQNFEQVAEIARVISSNLEGSGDLPLYTEHFLGYITDPPSGQSDYNDSRYYVRRAIPDMSKAATDQLVLQDDPFATSNSAYRSIITATNILELPNSTPNGSHQLRTNLPVMVFAFPERGNEGKVVYILIAYPPRPVFVHLQLNGSTPGSNGSVSAGVVTNATYKYDLLNPETGDPLSGNTTALTPAGNREQGPLTGPATIGMARLGFDGVTWTLIWCDERRAVVACP